MFSRENRRTVVLVISLMILSCSSVFAQKKSDKPDKKDKQIPANATRVLWSDPGNISSRDLFLGPGGAAMKPDLSRVTFVKVETGGFSTKYRVKDGSGRTWVVKVGQEARPETAAVRLAWAVGYATEVNYLYPCVQSWARPNRTKKNMNARTMVTRMFDSRRGLKT